MSSFAHSASLLAVAVTVSLRCTEKIPIRRCENIATQCVLRVCTKEQGMHIRYSSTEPHLSSLFIIALPVFLFSVFAVVVRVTKGLV